MMLGQRITRGEVKLLDEALGGGIGNVINQQQRRFRDALLEAILIPAAIRSTLDFSMLLRQAGVYVLNAKTNPLTSRGRARLRTVKDSLGIAARAYVGDFREIRRQTWNDMRTRNPALFRDATEGPGGRLALNPPDVLDLNVREDAFMTTVFDRMADMDLSKNKVLLPVKVPGKALGQVVSRAESAFTAPLNRIRFDMADQLIESAKKNGNVALDADGNVADRQFLDGVYSLVNRSTGRGGLGPAESLGPILNGIFWAPRLISSRVQNLGRGTLDVARESGRIARTGDVLARGNLTNQQRLIRESAEEFVGYLSAGMTILGTMKLAKEAEIPGFENFEVELDPRSSDFGKGKFGNTRFDFWGGHQQYIRFIAQLGTGERKSAVSGNLNEVPLEESVFRILRSKVQPGPVTTGVQELTRESFLEEPLSAPAGTFDTDRADSIDELGFTQQFREFFTDFPGGGSVRTRDAAQQFAPLIGFETLDLMREHGVMEGGVLSILPQLGVGAQTFGERAGTPEALTGDELRDEIATSEDPERLSALEEEERQRGIESLLRNSDGAFSGVANVRSKLKEAATGEDTEFNEVATRRLTSLLSRKIDEYVEEDLPRTLARKENIDMAIEMAGDATMVGNEAARQAIIERVLRDQDKLTEAQLERFEAAIGEAEPGSRFSLEPGPEVETVPNQVIDEQGRPQFFEFFDGFGSPQQVPVLNERQTMQDARQRQEFDGMSDYEIRRALRKETFVEVDPETGKVKNRKVYQPSDYPWLSEENDQIPEGIALKDGKAQFETLTFQNGQEIEVAVQTEDGLMQEFREQFPTLSDGQIQEHLRNIQVPVLTDSGNILHRQRYKPEKYPWLYPDLTGEIEGDTGRTLTFTNADGKDFKVRVLDEEHTLAEWRAIMPTATDDQIKAHLRTIRIPTPGSSGQGRLRYSRTSYPWLYQGEAGGEGEPGGAPFNLESDVLDTSDPLAPVVPYGRVPREFVPGTTGKQIEFRDVEGTVYREEILTEEYALLKEMELNPGATVGDLVRTMRDSTHESLTSTGEIFNQRNYPESAYEWLYRTPLEEMQPMELVIRNGVPELQPVPGLLNGTPSQTVLANDTP